MGNGVAGCYQLGGFGVCQGRGVRTCVCAASLQACPCVNGVCGALWQAFGVCQG